MNSTPEELPRRIDAAFEGSTPDPEAVEATIEGLDRGELRLAEPAASGPEWDVHAWIQRAILLYFGQTVMEDIEVGPFTFRDKIPLKRDPSGAGIRVVPPATVRRGAFVEAGAVLMPSYVNIGARVGSGSMIDTWATVGSGAQVGRDVHVAGGVGIGGVLEPPGARPVIVEDGCFLGSRVVLTEGWHLEREVVLRSRQRMTSIDGRARRDRGDARPAARTHPGALGRDPGRARPRLPGRHLRRALRADHRAALGVDRPQDVAERRAARVRRLGLMAFEPERLAELTLELVAVASVTGEEAALADLVETRCRSFAGARVERLGNAVVVRTGPDDPSAVALVGHLDTVPPWPGHRAYREGLRVVGRGAADMKGGDAAILAVLEHAAEHDRPALGIFYDREEGLAHLNGLSPCPAHCGWWGFFLPPSSASWTSVHRKCGLIRQREC